MTNSGTDSLWAWATAVTILVAPPPAETRQTAGFLVARAYPSAMLPAPPSCCAFMNFICGRLAMASPMANEVWASTPKIFSTPLELKYSTKVSAIFVSAIVSLLVTDSLIISATEKKQSEGQDRAGNRMCKITSRRQLSCRFNGSAPGFSALQLDGLSGGIATESLFCKSAYGTIASGLRDQPEKQGL